MNLRPAIWISRVLILEAGSLLAFAVLATVAWFFASLMGGYR